MSTPLTAVVVDDDPDITGLIEVVLGSVGLRVVHAVDGVAAVEAVREHAPVITTMDLGMPGMDGLSAIKRLRGFSATYLVVVTSRSSDADVIAAFEAGADDYLVKPFSPKELQLRAEAMLRRAASAPQEAPQPEEPWAVTAARDFRASLGRESPAPVVGQDPGAPEYDAPPVEAPTSADAPDPAAPAAPGAGRTGSRTHRKAGAAAAAPEEPSSVSWQGDVARFGSLSVDARSGAVELGGRRVALASEELDLLVALLRTGRRVRSRADMVLAVRGHTGASSHFVNEADKRAVDEHIASLQRALGDDPANPRMVETVRGVGFRLALPQA